MPLVSIDVASGRNPSELTRLLDSVHRAIVEAFSVPESDRYQILREHDPSHLVAMDTGLGLQRTDRLTIVQVTSRPRTADAKQAFFRLLAEKLEQNCGIPPSDVIVAIVANQDEDWSFGLGRAQFLTGEL